MSEDVRQIFHEQLLKYMKQNNKTQSDLSRDLHISLNTISGWYHGKTFPRPDKMQILADYLGVKVEDLLNNNDNLTTNITFKSESHMRTFAALRRATEDMDEEEMEKLIGFVDYYIKNIK